MGSVFLQIQTHLLCLQHLSVTQKKERDLIKVVHQNMCLLQDGESERTWEEPITNSDQVEIRIRELLEAYLLHYNLAIKAYKERVFRLKNHFAKVICITQNPNDLSTNFNIYVTGIGEFKGKYVPNQPPSVALNIDGVEIRTSFDQAAKMQFSIQGVGTFDVTFTPMPEQQQRHIKSRWAKTGGASTMTCPDTVKGDGLHNSAGSIGGCVEDFQDRFLTLTAHKVARTSWQIPLLLP